MHLLLPILLVAAALVMLAMVQRARAGKLKRLVRLVDARRSARKTAPAADAPGIAGRFLPGYVVRSLHLLGIDPGPRDAAAAAVVVGLPALAVGFALGPVPALALASVLLLGAAMVLNLLAARRIAELSALMPGFFDRIRQLLIVGNSLPTAFLRAVQGAQPRLTAFFGPTLRHIGNGAGFSESIRQAAEDIDLYEMRLFAAAVATNMRFGGSLIHSLNNLVSYLRKRSSIERELRANTAQIRASAWVLGLMPLLVATLIILQNPEYARWFTTHPAGRKMLAYCVLSQIVGAFLMRAVVRTRL